MNARGMDQARRGPGGVRRALAGCILLLWATAGAADQATLQASSYLVDLAGGLAIVVGIILVLAWVLRRMPGGVAGPGGQLIEILAVRSIGTRERLLLVRVGDEQLLLGVTAAGVSTLHRLRHPVAVPEPPPAVDMPSLLKAFNRRRDGP